MARDIGKWLVDLGLGKYADVRVGSEAEVSDSHENVRLYEPLDVKAV